MTLNGAVLHTDAEVDMSEEWTFVVGQRIGSATTWAVAIQTDTSFVAYHHRVCAFSSSCTIDGLGLYDDIDANGE